MDKTDRLYFTWRLVVPSTWALYTKESKCGHDKT